MKARNPLVFLLKKISWPVGLIIVAVTIASIGSLTGLLVPLFTGQWSTNLLLNRLVLYLLLHW